MHPLLRFLLGENPNIKYRNVTVVPAVVQPPVIDDSQPINLTLSVNEGQGDERQVTLSFDAQEGKSYRIESSTDLRNWQELESGITGNGDRVHRSFPANRTMWLLRVSEE